MRVVVYMFVVVYPEDVEYDGDLEIELIEMFERWIDKYFYN
ncbi:MAG: hypothetical protein NWE95_01995 [Candidatus Bathyarchaeota archaeon]|nr:hypothetical protein [Candidatus Bathyarchaeota archaeon]